MITIHKEILSADPVKPGSNIYKVTSLDGSLSVVQVFPVTLTSEEEGLFNQQVVSLEQAVADYGAALPFVLASGFTAGDYQPYIETEWIEGVSLEEKMRLDPTSNAAIKAAEQVSRILTICHKLGLAHGNLSTHNILWDTNRNRYVLTDFNLLDQYDSDKAVLMRKDLTDLGAMLYSIERKNSFQYPVWFSAALSRTTGQANGYALLGDFYVTIIKNFKEDNLEKRYRSKPQEGAGILSNPQVSKPQVVELKKPIVQEKPIEQEQPLAQEKPIQREKPLPPERPIAQEKPPVAEKPIGAPKPIAPKKSISVFEPLALKEPKGMTHRKKTFFTLNRVVAGGFIISLLLLGLYLYSEDQVKEPKIIAANTERETERERVSNEDEIILPETKPEQDVVINRKEEKPVITPAVIKKKESPVPKPVPVENNDIAKAEPTELPKETEVAREAKEGKELGVYKVRSKAYFHNKPDPGTKRKAFIVHWNNAKLRPLDEEGDFVYIVYTNVEGQTTKGWLAKKDLIAVE